MRHILFAVFLVVACAAVAAAASIEEAKSAYDRGDYAQAAQLFAPPLAEQGIASAQFNLGVMKWYRKAAEQGHALVQNNLGVLYEVGQGVPQDFARAHMWYSIGVKGSTGDEKKVSMKNRNSVSSQMTAAQIGKAQEMERRCQETKFKECDCD
jgi:TPR repeat protein